MKITRLLFLLLSITLLLFISACSDDDNDGGISSPPEITPDAYDWAIYLIQTNEVFNKTDEFMIVLEWLGDDSAISETDDFALKIDGEIHALSGSNYFGEWIFSAYADLEAGNQYNFEFFKNDNRISNARLQLPYQIDVIQFPDTFDPSTTTSLEWNLENDNQYQIISAMSYDPAEFDQEDEWEVVIPPSYRSYTIPPNAVTDFGPTTTYELLLTQINFTKTGRTAYLAGSITEKFYGEDIPVKLRMDIFRKITKRIFF